MRARCAELWLAGRSFAKYVVACARKSGCPSSTTQNNRAPFARCSRIACVLATAMRLVCHSLQLPLVGGLAPSTCNLVAQARDRHDVTPENPVQDKAVGASSPSVAKCSLRETNLAKFSSSRTVPGEWTLCCRCSRCTPHSHPCASIPNCPRSGGSVFTMSGGNDRPLNGIAASVSAPPSSSHT